MAKVSVSTDWTLSLMGAMPSQHPIWGPPPAPVPAAPHVEPPATMAWPPGMAASQNKWSVTVRHLKKPIALQGHDLGTLIPHIVTPNGWLAVTMLLSSRKMNFSASTVLMDGAPTGVSSFWAPTPMSYCSVPFAIPFTLPATNVTNTVNVGVTLGDMIAGLASIAINCAAGFISGPFGFVGQQIAGLFVGAVANALAGAVQVAATGQGAVGGQVGLGPLTVTVQRTLNPDGSESTQVQAGPWTWTKNPDGTWSRQGPSTSNPMQQTTSTQSKDGSTTTKTDDPIHGTSTSSTTPAPPTQGAVAPGHAPRG
ncbi:MAG TPA: hypothetical protein VHB21_20355 [Minicystis sp.]|nr:hypothetical protein [Minicystis sp.]